MDSLELLRPFAVARMHSVPIPIVLSYKTNLIKQLLTPNLQPD